MHLRRIDIIFTSRGLVPGVISLPYAISISFSATLSPSVVPVLDINCLSRQQSMTLILACRTMAVRELKGLQNIISYTVVHFHMGDQGWRFVQSEDELQRSQPDPLYHAKFLRELYFKAQPDYEGRFTVPVLWDKKTETIVNNESRSFPFPCAI